MMTYQPELLPFAGRLFGAGRLSILPDYALDSRQEQSLVSRWRSQSVPLAFVEFEEFWSSTAPMPPSFARICTNAMRMWAACPSAGDRVCTCSRSARERRRGTFGPHGLPCFR